MHVHLVDGTYELYRHHFGAPPMEAPDGMPIGASLGLFRSLRGLLEQPDVTHVGVAFDTVIESFRNQMFDGYKTGEGIEPELWAQFGLAEELARGLGVVVWGMVEFEADDALATMAARAAADPRVEKVLICSPDKDFAQCVVGDKVVLFDRRKREITNAEGVLQRYGVLPAQIPDWLALVGDTADGIPGIPRWGKKSAAQVLGTHRRIEDIPPDALDWRIAVRGASALAASLKDSVDDALLYRRLAQLRLDVPLKETVDDLCWRGPDKAALATLGTRLGRDLLNRERAQPQ